MKTNKKSAAVLQHYDAQRKIPNYSLASTLRDVKRLLSGALALLAAILAMLSYGSLVEQMDGWLISLPLCAMSTLATIALWRQAEGGDGYDE